MSRLLARITRTSVLEVLNEDYIRTARAKGLSELKVLVRHALRNAAVPIVTVIGISVALLIGGVVVTESVFNIPGLGRLTVDAVLARDYPTVQAVVLLFSLAYVVHQSGDRSHLYRARSADPLLKREARDDGHLADDPPPLGPSAQAADVEDAGRCVASQPGVWARVRGNVSARIGAALDPADRLDRRRRAAGRAPGIPTPSIRRAQQDRRAIETTIRNDDGKKVRYRAWMGTDTLGRDIYARVLYGARVSLIDRRLGRRAQRRRSASRSGVFAGYFRWLDGVIMRLMDGLMAIPAILLAIALVSLFGASL